jgi:Phosphatidylethanolamine-binding protein
MKISFEEEIEEGTTLTHDEAQKDIRIELTDSGRKTLLIYDQDAQYLHYLVVNIVRGQIQTGAEIISYSPPNPKDKTHTYSVISCIQNKNVINPVIYSRDRFSLDSFLVSNRLTLVERFQFKVTPKRNKDLKNFDKCLCYFEVTSRSEKITDLGLALRSIKEKCSNGFELCKYNTKDLTCNKYQIFEFITDDALRKYAKDRLISISIPYNRNLLIKRILEHVS